MNEVRMQKKIGINGFGRIGKLAVWKMIADRTFREIVINIGRIPGTKLEDVVCNYFDRDSTYGSLDRFVGGVNGPSVLELFTRVDEDIAIVSANNTVVRFLYKFRDPSQINWKEYGVKVVNDTTGKFLDPTISSDDKKGSIRGHLVSGAEKVIVSAPFKIKDKTAQMPDDAITVVAGINDDKIDKHILISPASCTTTCLTHTLKPLIDFYGDNILGCNMLTIHAATSTQEVLDRMPDTGKDDLRKSRAVFNNMILTSTGAAKAAGLIIPAINKMAFMANSIRVPTSTGSQIALTILINNPDASKPATKEEIRQVYKDAVKRNDNGYLQYSERQNVSSDIVANGAAAIIEGKEIDAKVVSNDLLLPEGVRQMVKEKHGVDSIPSSLTLATIYSWYDNEFGYTNMMLEIIKKLAVE